MSNCSQLPQWVSYLQALGVPFGALVFAGFGVWISARQMLIANEKVRLDSFNSQYERRFAVYDATRSILEKSIREKISETDSRIYGLRVLEARFLFDEEMYAYLKQVQERMYALWYAESKIVRKSDVDVETRGEYANIKSNTMGWIISQGGDDREGIRRFEPFLKYVAPSHPWLLRWP